ncbi:hypothetical protein AACH06_03180 [Ideonella sp. DXS29W]|uniref:Ligand-binding SRPBCC domain-containing protein n=1 Tax=Ideonella lacteola TaxID=2984193 RepID=A0ABU9BIN6_9BURK
MSSPAGEAPLMHVMHELVVQSRIAVHPEALWNEQSIATVNFELGPWIWMSAPATWQGVKLKDWDGQRRLFTSWVLLLRILPLDRHAFGTLDLSQPLSFVEHSSSWMNHRWRHERHARAVPGGCEVTDRVSFTPRIPLLAPLLKAIYLAVFRHRHARLRARHGALVEPSSKHQG